MQFMYQLNRANKQKNGGFPVDNHPAMFSFFPMTEALQPRNGALEQPAQGVRPAETGGR